MIPFLLRTPQPGWPRLTRPVPSPVPLRLSHGSAGSAPSTSPCVCPARTPGHQRRKLPLPLQLPGFRTAPHPCQGTSCAVATILLTLGLNTARAPPPGSRAPLGHGRPVSRVRVACALLRVGSGEESCPAPTLLNAGTLGTGKAWTRKAALLDPCPGAPALQTPEMCPPACGRPRGPHCAEPLPRPRPQPRGGLTHHLPFFVACILARFHPKAGCA